MEARCTIGEVLRTQCLREPYVQHILPTLEKIPEWSLVSQADVLVAYDDDFCTVAASRFYGANWEHVGALLERVRQCEISSWSCRPRRYRIYVNGCLPVESGQTFRSSEAAAEAVREALLRDIATILRGDTVDTFDIAVPDGAALLPPPADSDDDDIEFDVQVVGCDITVNGRRVACVSPLRDEEPTAHAIDVAPPPKCRAPGWLTDAVVGEPASRGGITTFCFASAHSAARARMYFRLRSHVVSDLYVPLAP